MRVYVTFGSRVNTKIASYAVPTQQSAKRWRREAVERASGVGCLSLDASAASANTTTVGVTITTAIIFAGATAVSIAVAVAVAVRRRG